MSEKTISLIQKMALRLTANSFCQELIERNISRALYLMGIGFGAQIATSGEDIALQKIAESGKTDLCIFDVGANRAQFSNMVLGTPVLANRNINLHCFEPSKITFDILKKNLLYQNDSIILNNLGLGIKQEKRTLFYNSLGSGWASLTKRRLDHYNKKMDLSEVVRIDSLDNYCKEKKIEYIDLLKIDVEGHELDVLKGASEVFANKRIGALLFEFGGCNIDTRTFFQDFYYFFQEQDMKIHRITPTGYLYPINNYSEKDEQFRTTNFLVLS